MPDREKVIRIIDELIFEAQKKPTWKAENALRCVKKELLKEQERTGTWKDNGNGTISCSECGTWFPREREPYLCFCGWCGAKMEGR